MRWVLWLGALLLVAAGCQAAQTPIRVGIQDAIQPFALPAQDAGLLVEVVRAAFAVESVAAKFEYMPNERIQAEYRSGQLDVATNAKPHSGLPGVLSQWPIVTFRTQAITLAQKIPHLANVAAMDGLRVVAFQNARKVLGPDYAAMAARNPSYKELAHMPGLLLFLDRADVIVSQADVLRYWLLNQSLGKVTVNQLNQLAYHPLFGQGNPYWFAFKSTTLRDQFERGLKAIYASGQIDQIFARYARQYGTSRDMFIELDCRFLEKGRPKSCAQSRAAH